MSYKDASEWKRENPQGLRAAAAAAEFEALEEGAAEEKERQEEAARAAAEEREQYYREHQSAGDKVQAFINRVADRVNTPFIPTGFSKLDRELDGGLYEGLYFIGAISSLGKTTFILQIADQIAAAGHDVLFFTLEQSEFELMAKSISRLTFEGCKGKTKNAKTARGITTYTFYENYSQEEKELLANAYSEYQQRTQGRLYFVEGVGDIGVETGRESIKARVEKHIRATGRKPVIIIDYLQILAPADPRASDKQNTDRAVNALKRLSRDHKLTVIGISSFNRDNYYSPVNMSSFKESGAIEYSSDILLALQPAGMGNEGEDSRKKVDECKKEEKRAVELVILKNRNGKTGGRFYYDYYSLFNCFKETEGGADQSKAEQQQGSFSPYAGKKRSGA